MIRISPWLASALVFVTAVSASAADVKHDFFENKIRPMLIEHCYKCHSADAVKAKKLKGGLLLDTAEGLMKGGDSGPALVPSKPKESMLMKSLHYTDDLQMPPSGKLAANIIADFEKWIADGAVDPRKASATSAASTIDLEKGKQFWAFQKPVASEGSIDFFIQTQLKKNQLVPSSQADKRTLLMRVYIDLIGLPPTPEQMEAFLKDQSKGAFEKVVNELLASPQYGERWARTWLDVARYAEDQAHTFAVKPKSQAWRYRDWVVDALNADMPYDRFVKLQIAGDLLTDADMDPTTRYAGLGFLGLGAEYYKNSAKEQAIADELDDRVDTVTRGFLGITVSCARCHDHKFDPIPQVDYYSIAGIFAGSNFSDAPLGSPAEQKAFNDAQNSVKQAENKLNKAQADAKKMPKDTKLADEVKKLTEEVAKLKKAVPPAPPVAHILSGGATGMKVFIRGNPLKPGDAAPKGFLQVLSTNNIQQDASKYNRLDLANAIASPDNPLTARVIVNRIWQGHFGRGIVNTPSNFGALGDKPSHPALLDTLAARFMEQGWSMKWLHKEIVMSRVYQQSSAVNKANDNLDAVNVNLWRANRHRLDVEMWRDRVLMTAGTLDSTLGGPTFNLKDSNSRRRTLYAKISRHELDGLLRLFDFPDANVTADRRTTTTVPQQQLFVLNSDFIVNQAKAFASRIEKAGGTTDEAFVKQAYRLAFSRVPSESELSLGQAFLKAKPDAADKLTRQQQYAQILLASNELMYVD